MVHKIVANLTLMIDHVLEYLAKKAGADRVMLGSDHPFPIGDPEPTKVVETAQFSDVDRAKILGSTARRVFRLRPDCWCRP